MNVLLLFSFSISFFSSSLELGIDFIKKMSKMFDFLITPLQLYKVTFYSSYVLVFRFNNYKYTNCSE